MNDFIRFITRNRSAEAYIATRFTILITNIIIITIVLTKWFGLNLIVSLLLAYVLSLLLTHVMNTLFETPYLVIDYVVRKTPLIGPLVYTLGGILMMPYIYILNSGKSASFQYIL
jgi:hypothetical protein